MTREHVHLSKEKCVIIGLDGLEYDLVEKFRMEKVKQREYGKIELSGFEVLATPIIWASFITGLSPEEHKVDPRKMWDNDALEKLSGTPLGVGLYKSRRILEFLGFKRTHHRKKHFMQKGIKTLFDIVEDSVALNVPSYQEYASDEISKALHDAIEDSSKETEFETMVWEVFKRRKEECLRRFREGNWNLFMAYFNFTDHFGHVFRGDLLKMSKVYLVAEKLVGDLKSETNDEGTLFLVVSDHGMKPLGRYGDHSDYGFYSINEELCLKEPKITDFFQIVLNKLDLTFTRADKEKIIERLKRLGYFD